MFSWFSLLRNILFFDLGWFIVWWDIKGSYTLSEFNISLSFIGHRGWCRSWLFNVSFLLVSFEADLLFWRRVHWGELAKVSIFIILLNSLRFLNAFVPSLLELKLLAEDKEQDSCSDKNHEDDNDSYDSSSAWTVVIIFFLYCRSCLGYCATVSISTCSCSTISTCGCSISSCFICRLLICFSLSCRYLVVLYLLEAGSFGLLIFQSLNFVKVGVNACWISLENTKS